MAEKPVEIHIGSLPAERWLRAGTFCPLCASPETFDQHGTNLVALVDEDQDDSNFILPEAKRVVCTSCGAISLVAQQLAVTDLDQHRTAVLREKIVSGRS